MSQMKSLFLLLGLFTLILLSGCVSDSGSGTPSSVPTTTSQTPIPTPTTTNQTPLPTPTITSQTPVPTTSFPPLPGTAENISVNWAGYAVETSFTDPEKNSMDAVEAMWNVPLVDCSLSPDNYASAFWVGIDGFSSLSVEQIGTDSDCIQGSPSYYAWYEMYPKDSVTLDITMKPGDEVHARVEYTGNNKFQFTIRNAANGERDSITDTSTVADRSSAEWIAEAPVFRHRILLLSDFGPVYFLNASVTVKGVTGPITSTRWAYQPIVMKSRGGGMKATPSGLINNGTSFSIMWDHP